MCKSISHVMSRGFALLLNQDSQSGLHAKMVCADNSRHQLVISVKKGIRKASANDTQYLITKDFGTSPSVGEIFIVASWS